MGNYPFKIPSGGAPVEWLNVVTEYGADPSGAADSAAAIQAAATAAITAGGGTVYIPAGTYKTLSTITVNVNGTVVRVIADAAAVISYHGTGDCLKMYDSNGSSDHAAGSGIFGLAIDGTNATGSGACGFHLGDMLQFGVDIIAKNFSGTGGIGVHFDNNYSHTEQLKGRIYAYSNATNVMFDVGNSGGTADVSFDRMDLAVWIDSNGVGDGVTFNGGALTADSRLAILGNMNTSTTAYAALRVTGSFSGAFSAIILTELLIGVELNDTVHTAPYTIFFGSGSNQVFRCTGIMDFSQSNTFTASNNSGNLNFTGVVKGDSALSSTLPNGSTNLADSPQVFNSVTATAITSVTLPVAASTAYIIEIYIPHLGAGATGTFTFALGGPSIALANLDIELWTGTTLTAHTQNSASATLSAVTPAASQRTLLVKGSIAFGSAGTLTVTGAISAGGSNVTVDIGAYVNLQQISAP